ncbi:hypothetical protein ACS0TY_005474 [Phlomoides rotata]
MINEVGEEMEEATEDNNSTNTEATLCAAASRQERRKAAKKEKRKKKRKEMAEMVRRQEEVRLNDLEEQLRLQAEEEQEKLRAEKELREFEEKERKIREEWEKRKALEQREKEEEEEKRRRAEEEEHQLERNQVEPVDEDGWEYVEEGPPEIIWQGNEIIVKKKKVRVKKKDADQQFVKEDPNRPTSNPLPPQSEVFAHYKNAPNLSAQELLQNVAQETPNFGTEQDKAHCPFHLKTGACRFGSRCSRIHFYPDKSCTFLIKNMYNGPGLAWEQDEGLEYTDEEVEHAYEEFYEDVHTEFLKFGEIVNFKVCRNGSSHLRGNVYVHYKSLDSAMLSYRSVNGRYFAGKQLQCEFVGVTRWKVAICGEFMKSKLQACSRGMACNFIHCFRNPGGDYEWADWDKPPPRYWLKKMAALFGYSDELVEYENKIDRRSPRLYKNSRRTLTDDADRSQSRDIDRSRSSRYHVENDVRTSEPRRRHRIIDRKHSEDLSDEECGDLSNSREKSHRHVSIDRDSERICMDNFYHHEHSRRRTRHRDRRDHSDGSKQKSTSPDGRLGFGRTTYDSDLTVDRFNGDRGTEESPRSEEFEHKKSKRRKISSSSSKDDLVRRKGEDERDSESRPGRNSGSSSKYYSQSDRCKLEQGEGQHHLRKSERKRGSSRTQCHEACDERDRWEPNTGDISE